jgi:tetratricopeptide (TPR) repeat protein
MLQKISLAAIMLLLFNVAGAQKQPIAKDNIPATFASAKKSLMIGEWGDAIADFSLIIRADSSYENAWVQRGLAYMQIDSLTDAYNDLSMAITLKPKDTMAVFTRILLLIQTEKYKQATAEINNAMVMLPNAGKLYYFRGITGLILKQTKQACDDLKKASYMGIKQADDAIEKYCK